MLQRFPFFSASLQRRAWFLLTPLVVIFFIVLAYLLENSFKRSMVSGVEAQLAIQIRLLLADVESDQIHAFNVLAVEEPALNSPSGSLLAMAVDDHGKLLWQSPSVELSGARPESLLDANYSAALGESRFSELSRGGFRLVQTIAFDLEAIENSAVEEANESRLSGPIHLVFIDSGKVLYQQVGMFRETLLLSLSAALVVFVVFQFLLLRWLFRPMRELGQELRQIESAEKSKFENSYPNEIAPLTRQLNRFIDAERAQRERYRNTLSDLAHSLKTPLAAIKSSMAAVKQQSTDSLDVQEQIDRMEQIVSHQLRRSSLGGAGLVSASSDASAIANRLLAALQKVYASKAVDVENQVVSDLLIAMPEDDFFEVLGNLLDNAFKYCRKQVVLKSSLSNDSQLVCIENDGELISQQDCSRLLARGARLDESQPGQGLGLSVAQSIVRACGGELALEPVAAGGLRVALRLPMHNKKG